jgi:hypothetical protein
MPLSDGLGPPEGKLVRVPVKFITHMEKSGHGAGDVQVNRVLGTVLLVGEQALSEREIILYGIVRLSTGSIG